MRRILARFVPIIALVAGLTLLGGPIAGAHAASASATGQAQRFDIWCC